MKKDLELLCSYFLDDIENELRFTRADADEIREVYKKVFNRLKDLEEEAIWNGQLERKD